MSQEIPVVTPPKQEMPQQIRDNLIAGTTSQESLQPQKPIKLTVDQFATKIKQQYPQYD